MTIQTCAIMGAAIAVLGACASPALTPSVETTQTLTKYEISNIDYDTASQILVDTMKVQVSRANVQRNLVTGVLPTEPGGIEIVNPLEGSPLAGMASMAGQVLAIPSCPQAPLSITAINSSYQKYGENTNYAACLWPYEGGLHMEIFASFTIRSGGLSAAEIGRGLARSAMGDSSQFIERTRSEVMAALETAGANVEETARY